MSDNVSVIQLLGGLGAGAARCEMPFIFPYGSIEHYKIEELQERNVKLYVIARPDGFFVSEETAAPTGLTPGKHYEIINLSVEDDHDELRVEIEDDQGIAYRTNLLTHNSPLMLDIAAINRDYEAKDQNDTLKEIEYLVESWNTYIEEEETPSFVDGEFVRWKKGLAANGFPVKAVGRIVKKAEFIRQMDRINQERQGIELYDCVVAYLDKDGDLAFAPCFARRLEKVMASTIA